MLLVWSLLVLLVVMVVVVMVVMVAMGWGHGGGGGGSGGGWIVPVWGLFCEVTCDVISVGTYCSNVLNHGCANSLAVKCVIYYDC